MNIILNTSDPNATITINVRCAKKDDALKTESAAGVLESMDMLESLEAAGSKKDRELAMDFSSCSGFSDQFMGFKTPLPKLGKQLLRKVALYTADHRSYILRYPNYSTVHHAVRRVPVVSAINIDGNPAKRMDERKRKDDWLRDNRIDFDVQLNDAYYRGSGFDKGHLARREDANWGKTEDDAFYSANVTCMYTNACPQVPDLNRGVYGYHGLWGQLEQIILEKGVEQEEGKSTKICVYNGPIFLETDPVYKGVQVPLRYFKVIVWLNGKGQKRTTAFILSQEDLVNDIQFEELMFDEEFKEHQCSIEYLESLTDLTFTTISAWDTFVDDGVGAKGVKSLAMESMEELVKANA